MPIRPAEPSDAAACAQIYTPYVRESTITFELEPPTEEQMAARIAASRERWEWLVAETDGRVTGYAYGGPFKERAAYRWACEVSVYLEMGRRRTGQGRELYEALFERLAERGYLLAIAVMTLPNPASDGLHRAMGFEPIGTFPQVGFKHGEWRDVEWLQRSLAAKPEGQPPEPE